MKIADRVKNRATLVPLVAEVLREKTMTEWIDLLEPVNVPCGPIYNIKQVFEDPQVVHRNIRTDIPHGSGVHVPNVANPIHLSETPIVYTHGAPMLGEHTADVLERLAGLTRDDINSLQTRGIV